MEPFRDNVFYLLLWRAILAALIGLVSMATCRLGPAATTLIGANVALLFSLGLMASLQWSAGQRIVWTKAWRMLPANRRPAGQSGRRLARDCQRDLTLRFAQGASAVLAPRGIAMAQLGDLVRAKALLQSAAREPLLE
jgi:hypothetical protein